MKTLKHIGKLKNTGSKVIVVFRTIPGESNTALVMPTETLSDEYHNSLMALIETDEAQQTFEFGEIMFTRLFPDGRPMLRAAQADGRLQKIPTDKIIMTPSPTSDVPLDQLNVLIAEQKNCTIDDLCTFVKGYNKPETSTVKDVASVSDVAESTTLKADDNSVLSDKDLAKSYRSQADAMYKEAAKLRKQADDIDPPQKKTVKVKETEGV
jgi:hypothetical protein